MAVAFARRNLDMPTTVKVRVRLDKRALDKQLTGRTGAVGRVLAGFGGVVTKEIKGVFKDQAGGAWWPVKSQIQDGGSRGIKLVVTTKRNRPHRISAKNAPVLFFKLADGQTFIGQSVNHPGSSPPEGLILTGIERAGRRLTFTRAAPTVTRSN